MRRKRISAAISPILRKGWRTVVRPGFWKAALLTLGRIAGAIIFAGMAVLHLALSRHKGTLLICTNPPVLPFVGLVLKKLRRQRYICLVHDIYPQIAVRLGFLTEGSPLVRIWERLNAYAYCEADAVIAVSRCMAETLTQQARTQNLRPRIHVIHNWADSETLTPQPKERNWMSARYGTIGKLAIVYSGNMGWYHDFDTLLEAARLVRDDDGIQFLFIGDGARRQYLVTVAERWRLTNVRFLPYQPTEALPYTLTCGDLAAVTLARGTEGLCMPGKLYTALAAGQAILAIVGRDSELAAIVEEHRCGFRIDQGDAGGVVEAFRYAIENPASLDRMKQNARRCFELLFTRQQAMQQYYELLSGIIRRTQSGQTNVAAVSDRHGPTRVVEPDRPIPR
jgi:glycosyltransferase involved in cell wall biosynthesis